MPSTKKPKKLKIKDYTMYDFIAMTPEDAGKVLFEECEKKKPNIEVIKNILEHSPVDVNKELYSKGGYLQKPIELVQDKPEVFNLLVKANASLAGISWEVKKGDVFNGNIIEELSCPNCGSYYNHNDVDEFSKSWTCYECNTTGEDIYDTDGADDPEPEKCPECKSKNIYMSRNEYCGDYYDIAFECSDCGYEIEECGYDLIFEGQEFTIPE